MDRKLMKISSVKFGLGGYQGAMIGLHLQFSGGSYGVGDSYKAFWDAETIECSTISKWSEQDRDAAYSKLVRAVSKILNDAKVSSVDELKGKPVEVVFDRNMLKYWRILTELL